MEAALLVTVILGSIVQADDLQCPARADLQADLSQLGAPELATRPERVEVVRTGRSISVRLLSVDGDLVAEQTFPASSPCAALAQAVAIVIAGWAASWPAAPSSLPAAPPSAPEPTTTLTNRPSSASPRLAAWHYDLDAALLGSFTAQGATAAGIFQFTAFRPQHDWGVELSLTGEGARGSPLAPGTVSWQRTALLLGPAYRWAQGRWAIEIALQAALALATASGRDVPQAGGAWSFNPGIDLSLRGAFKVGPVEPFIGLWPTGWLPEVAKVQGTGSAEALPQLELLVGAGVAWTQF